MISSTPQSSAPRNTVATLKLGFFILAILAYAIPLVHSFLTATNFSYVNAWDEETYLTYQGAQGSMGTPGYWTSSSLVFAMQLMGLSGSKINLIFDTLITPTTLLLIAWIIARHHIERTTALAYAVIILFSAIFFNFGNPLIADFFTRQYGALVYGFEPYQSALRTPEPQLSYFITCLSIAAYLRFRKTYILLLPLPLLYFYVGIVYGYFVVVYLQLNNLKLYRRRCQTHRILLASGAAWALTSIGLLALDFLLFSRDPIFTGNPLFYLKSHMPVLPISGLFALTLLAVQYLLRYPNDARQQSCLNLQLAAAAAILLISNLHVIAGVMLSYKNYMDYSIAPITGLSLALFILSLSYTSRLQNLIVSIVSILITYLSFKAYGFDFKTGEYHFYRGLQFKSEQTYREVLNDPLSFIIPDSDISAKLPYSAAGMPIPMFAYQYDFPFISKGCENIHSRMKEAISYLQQDAPETFRMNESYFRNATTKFSNGHVPKSPVAPAKAICQPPPGRAFKILDRKLLDNGFSTIHIY
ncbi:hypothetical protein ACFW6U_24415 [Pseudomonas guariconensis]|uniref:hypothetical protein n=1 Tax=Pseudomonas guariconensis TaxID=1288410 RepID=UPI0036718F91